MVVVLDLDEEPTDHSAHDGIIYRSAGLQLNGHRFRVNDDKKFSTVMEAEQKRDPNLGGFSAALACYPVVAQLANDLDLNSLHNLSRTCRLFRACLVAHRKQLISMTLRCSNDDSGVVRGQDPQGSYRRDWHIMGYETTRTRMTSGRVSPCATDLVGECLRCGTIICRNCAMKPLSSTVLPNRLRRLCQTCRKAPLSTLIGPHLDLDDSPAFTCDAFVREACSCPDFMYICRSCSRSIASADTDYKRIWTWRTRYSTYLGGLGTGIGEGYEGVKCGRGENCLAARFTEVEVDCDAAGIGSASGTPKEGDSRPSSQQSDSDGSGEDKAGYFRQEVEGIGGAMRGKVKRRVKVGQTVVEYEDERESGEYLVREARGGHRGWCGWCDRVVPGKKDKSYN